MRAFKHLVIAGWLGLAIGAGCTAPIASPSAVVTATILPSPSVSATLEQTPTSIATGRTNPVQMGRDVLLAFLGALAEKRYAEAAALYGGSYEQLFAWNQSITSTTDYAELWRHGCEINGLQCLPVRDIQDSIEVDQAYEYLVRFSRPDGTLFRLPTCCDVANQDNGQSEFPFRVNSGADAMLVLTMPPYVS